MTSKDLASLMNKIITAYPNYKLPNKEGLKFWLEQLEYYPAEACYETLNFFIRHKKYPPTLHDFVEQGSDTVEDIKKRFRKSI